MSKEANWIMGGNRGVRGGARRKKRKALRIVKAWLDRVFKTETVHIYSQPLRPSASSAVHPVSVLC